MKTKALISFAVTAKLICVFVFTYAKEAHIITLFIPLKYNSVDIILFSSAQLSIKFELLMNIKIAKTNEQNKTEQKILRFKSSNCWHCNMYEH